MFDYRRTHTCGELSLSDSGKTVLLSGWVHRHRDLGSLTFIDLRDRFGMTQIVFDPAKKPQLKELVAKIRSEWVISVRGSVNPRASGMANTRLSTGEIEILLEEIEILSPAKTPPFVIADDKTEIGEDLRLKYRYLDIRKGEISKNLVLRHNLMRHTRQFLHDNGFLEITTPILGKSTPEGARDYLVPSRVYPGNFYALPQSPQIFKQLLMVSGMDRYFQIATCFRDEDLRADRQPEFTQIDLEMSFMMPEDLMQLIENLVAKLFKECNKVSVPTPFPRMSYQDCMEYYGCDRPDLRFGMPLVRLDDLAKQSTFTVFVNELSTGGCVKALCVKKGALASRKEIENYTTLVQKLGLKGLAWIKTQQEGTTSSILKFLSTELIQQIFSRIEAEEGDLILIGAGPEERVNQGLDHLRRHIGKEKGWMDPHILKFLWVTDFPLLRWNAEEKRMESEHHPFTAPHPEDISLLDTDPLRVRALAYDLVLNGYEIGGGSQRIHNSLLQEKIFQTLNLSPEEIFQKFGFFVEALKYGTPPHLGIALGLDRLVMLLAKTDNIRDVIAFPKTQKASDLMMQSPSSASDRQLKELEIQTTSQEISWN